MVSLVFNECQQMVGRSYHFNWLLTRAVHQNQLCLCPIETQIPGQAPPFTRMQSLQQCMYVDIHVCGPGG